MLSRIHDMKSRSLTVPIPKSSYTQAAAAIEKSKIQDAYFAGLIDWGQNRALKLLVTTCTEGGVPNKRSLRHVPRASLSTTASDPATPLPSSGEGSGSASVLANRSIYRHPESTIEELKNEDASAADAITSDEKHGSKVLLTKSIAGRASPAASTNIGHARRDQGQQSRAPERGHSLDTRRMQMSKPPRPSNRVAGGSKSTQVPYSGVETYCIVPYRRTYRVEAISADGVHRVLDVWPTEEAAVSRLRTLQVRADLADRRTKSFTQDRRG